jgi:hypothetical protein
MEVLRQLNDVQEVEHIKLSHLPHGDFAVASLQSMMCGPEGSKWRAVQIVVQRGKHTFAFFLPRKYTVLLDDGALRRLQSDNRLKVNHEHGRLTWFFDQ